MNAKRTIRKILFVAMWLAIGSGMLTLLIAAVSKQKRDSCRDFTITIQGDQSATIFLDKGAITKLLKDGARGPIKGQSKMSFDLQWMETLLERNVWIKDAQLYFDNQAVLHVTIEEREPVARVFTTDGRSFYVDKDEKLMPLSDKVFTQVPVFTDFPDRKKLTKEDSALVHGINITAQYISSHPFWTSQIAQTDIVTACGVGCWEFEMTPVVGNHVIKFGTAEDVEGKFDRLFSFYQQVLSRTGLDRYKTVDVRFNGQVVGGKSENPKVDSVLLRRSVERFTQQANEMTDSLPPVLNPVQPRTDGI